MEHLRFPTGRYQRPLSYDADLVQDLIEKINTLPERIELLVESWPGETWETSYREGGWNGREVLHHILDSHLNCLIRLKWALTEDSPVIRTYLQDEWVRLADYQTDPLTVIPVLKGIHYRLMVLFSSMNEEAYRRKLIHPEHPGSDLDLLWMLGMYTWHGEHHLGHLSIIDRLRSGTPG